VTIIAALVLAAEPVAEEVSEKQDLYPAPAELVVGLIAFAIVFAFMAKWVLPRVGKVLDERREKIRGDLEKAEQTRRDAEKELADYREKLANAREEANRIIEEARKTAEQLRKDMAAKAEQESRQTVAKAQDEIRAERDRVFQELQQQVGQLSVRLAGIVVGEELDAERHAKLIDDYVKQVSKLGNGDAG